MERPQQDGVPAPFVGSNDAEGIFNITIEVLDALLGNVDATKQRLQVLDFSEPHFQLLSLSGIDFIGVSSPSIRAGVKTLNVASNQLTTLIDLVDPLTQKALFPRIEHIFAPNNLIQYMCSSRNNILLNEWPARFENLLELDLSGNYLTSIPQLTYMRKIRKLDLRMNRIRPPWKQLKVAKELEELDLAGNQLDWTEAEFMLELKVLRELHMLRELSLADNPFCTAVPQYAFFCLKELAFAQERFLGGSTKRKYNIQKIDGADCNESFFDRARSTLHPEFKRRQFLQNIGLKKNARLVDKERESDYIKRLVDENVGRETSDMPNLFQLQLLAERCLEDHTAATPAVSAMLKYSTRIRDRTSNVNAYLFEDLIPPIAMQDKEARAGYEQLAVDKFMQTMILLVQRVPLMVGSFTRILGYLAGVPDSNSILGRAAMSTLTHLASGGRNMQQAVQDCIKDCVISQLVGEDRHNRPNVHDTIVRGLFRYVKRTGHSQVLRGVASAIGSWLYDCMDMWISSPNVDTWESHKLLKYLQLAIVASTDRESAIKLGAHDYSTFGIPPHRLRSPKMSFGRGYVAFTNYEMKEIHDCCRKRHFVC